MYEELIGTDKEPTICYLTHNSHWSYLLNLKEKLGAKVYCHGGDVFYLENAKDTKDKIFNIIILDPDCNFEDLEDCLERMKTFIINNYQSQTSSILIVFLNSFDRTMQFIVFTNGSFEDKENIIIDENEFDLTEQVIIDMSVIKYKEYILNRGKKMR